jgi:hypothetical protein
VSRDWRLFLDDIIERGREYPAEKSAVMRYAFLLYALTG